ncbi:hypothetical protein DTO271G3_8180 [Paecilomyces variotii]|nr:hypothetical protein DTO271G3_8180 [Paecilomyces variotii]
MFRGWWLRAFEIWLTGRLLASPTFHRMVGKVHRGIHNFRHGIPPEEMGGTKIDNNGIGFSISVLWRNPLALMGIFPSVLKSSNNETTIQDPEQGIFCSSSKKNS